MSTCRTNKGGAGGGGGGAKTISSQFCGRSKGLLVAGNKMGKGMASAVCCKNDVSKRHGLYSSLVLAAEAVVHFI